MSLTRKETKKHVRGTISDIREKWIGLLWKGSYRDLEITVETTEGESIGLSISPEEPFEESNLYKIYLAFKNKTPLKIEGTAFQRSYGFYPFYFMRGPTDFTGRIETPDESYSVVLWEAAQARDFYNGSSSIVRALG